MTENTTTEITDVNDADITEDTAPDALEATETPEPEATEEQADETNPSRREAAYRVKLRETESMRDQLLDQVNALRQSEIERIAGESIANGAAIWVNGVTIDSLLADDGTVDPAAVRAAADAAADDLGLKPARRPNSVPKEGQVTGHRGGGNGWADAFTPS